MSRRLLMAAALVVFTIPVATMKAQMGYGLGAGVATPMGDFGKATSAGYQLTGMIGFSAPHTPVGLRLEGSLSEFKYKLSFSPRGAKARLLSATANAVFTPPGLMGPYLIAGFGLYHASAVCDRCTTSSSKGGFNVGGGVKFGLGRVSAFLEARYHHIPGPSDPTNGGVKSSTRFIPITFGVTF